MPIITVLRVRAKDKHRWFCVVRVRARGDHRWFGPCAFAQRTSIGGFAFCALAQEAIIGGSGLARSRKGQSSVVLGLAHSRKGRPSPVRAWHCSRSGCLSLGFDRERGAGDLDAVCQVLGVPGARVTPMGSKIREAAVDTNTDPRAWQGHLAPGHAL